MEREVVAGQLLMVNIYPDGRKKRGESCRPSKARVRETCVSSRNDFVTVKVGIRVYIPLPLALSPANTHVGRRNRPEWRYFLVSPSIYAFHITIFPYSTRVIQLFHHSPRPYVRRWRHPRSPRSSHQRNTNLLQTERDRPVFHSRTPSTTSTPRNV